MVAQAIPKKVARRGRGRVEDERDTTLEANVEVGSLKCGDMYGDFEHFTGTGLKPYQATIVT
jgi:hypothetical protein